MVALKRGTVYLLNQINIFHYRELRSYFFDLSNRKWYFEKTQAYHQTFGVNKTTSAGIEKGYSALRL